MKTSSCKAKGRRAANEVKELIHRIFPELSDEDVFRERSGSNGEDIKFSEKARGMLPISIEVKNVELLNIWKAMKQAESNAGKWIPVLFFRRNKSKLYAAIEAEELLALLRMRLALEAIHASEVSAAMGRERSNGSGNKIVS
jgi:hypothetical protein